LLLAWRDQVRQQSISAGAPADVCDAKTATTEFTMTIHYYPETDSLYIDLKSEAGVDAVEIADGLVADLDSGGHVVGIDIERASERLDLSAVETFSLPVPTPRTA
jgi:uncharacterized protein YuzE